MKIQSEDAIHLLKTGNVVAIPTETVYGLAASLSQPPAIEQIFTLKGRPSHNPLIIHVADESQLKPFVKEYPPGFSQLAKAFWPGPMTLILPIQPHVIPSIVTAGLSTAGFRIPNLDLTLHIIKATGPLVMPSANLSGRPSATSAAHVEEDFGRDFPVLDGGSCQKGLESTILIFQDGVWVIIRQGSLPPIAFEEVLGYQPEVITTVSADKPICPGQLYRHYAPKAQLILGDRSRIHEAACIVGFKDRLYPHDKRQMLLGSLDQPEEVAANLYKILRQLDQENIPSAWVDMDFPSDGIWKTIAERLTKASD